MRSKCVLSLSAILGAAAAVSCVSSTVALAGVYTDATGTSDHYSDGYADIQSVVITNDLTNLIVTVNVNPLHNDGTTPTNIQNENFTRYDMGFQIISPSQPNGGNTSLVEPFGQMMGISTGQHYNLEGWANQNAAPSTLGGYALNHWNGASWDNVGNSSTDVVTPTAKTFTVPLASLGLSGGGSFYFDVWTTFSGSNGAYDALANPTLTTQPFGTIVAYDSATASGSQFGTAAYRYDVVVPEPATLGILGASVVATLIRRRRHSSAPRATSC